MLVFDVVDPAELIGFVREIPAEEYGFTLDRFLPNEQVDDIEYAFDRADRVRQDVAGYRAFDVPAEIGKRPGIARVRGAIPPLSKKIPLGEEQRLRLQALQGMDRARIREQVFNDAELMVESVQARIELARGQALSTGTVTFENDRGFVDAEIDYGTPPAHFPTAGILWSASNATPVADLRAWVRDYKARNRGRAPAAILVADEVIDLLLLNAEVRTLLSDRGVTPTLLTREQVASLLSLHGIPPLVAYDTSVSVGGSDVRVIPGHKIVFVPPASTARFGSTAYGVTAEALELAEEGRIELTDAPGLVAVNDKTFDPVQLWTKAAGLAVPVIKDPNLIYAPTVLAA